MRSTRRSRRPDESDLLQAVQLIYDAAVAPEAWPAVLERMNEMTDSAVATLLVQDFRARDGSSLWHAGADPTLIAEYADWAPQNIYLNRADPLMQTGVVLRGEAVVADREAMATEYFNEYLRRVGVLHNLGACLFREETFASMLILLRRLGKPFHDPEDERLLRSLVPHLQRAVSIHRQLEGLDLRRATAERALDELTIGVVFVDERGRATFFNDAARAILAGAEGLRLTATGQLTAVHPGEAARLGALLGRACETGAGRGLDAGGAVRISRPSAKRDLAVLVAPLRGEKSSLSTRRPFAAVFISDPDRDAAGVEPVLQQLYGLTPAEARFARHLLEGRRVEEVCDALGVTENTARTHVRRILDKASAHGQADLLRVLVSGPAAVRSTVIRR